MKVDTLPRSSGSTRKRPARQRSARVPRDDQQVAPDNQHREPHRQMALERQGQEQAVHQHLVGNRIEHGAEGVTPLNRLAM